MILCAVGVSWLVYFNRKKVCEVFAGGMGEAPQSRRPFLIAVIAILNLFGAATCLLMVFLPIPGAIFGLLLHGWQKAALYLAFAALELAVGVGLWRMAEWGRRLTLAMMVLMLAQSVVYLVRPSLLLQYSAELTQTMTPTQPPLPALLRRRGSASPSPVWQVCPTLLQRRNAWLYCGRAVRRLTWTCFSINLC